MADLQHHNTREQQHEHSRVPKTENKRPSKEVHTLVPPTLQLSASTPGADIGQVGEDQKANCLTPFQLQTTGQSNSVTRSTPFKITNSGGFVEPTTQLKPFSPEVEAPDTDGAQQEIATDNPGAFSPPTVNDQDTLDSMNPAAAFNISAAQETTPSPQTQPQSGEQTANPEVAQASNADIEGMANEKAEEKKSEGASENPAGDAGGNSAQGTPPAESGAPQTGASPRGGAPPMGGAGASIGAIPAPTMPAANKLSNSKAGQMANDIFTKPASKLASNMPNVGKDFNQAFSEDRSSLADQTPPVKGEIETGSIPKAPPAPNAPSTKSANMPKWKAPASKIKKKDAPRFQPSGAANPALVDQQADGEQQKALQDQQKAAQGISSMPGADRVQGKDMTEVKDLALSASTTTPDVGMTPEMETYLQMPMPEGFRSQVDLAAAPNFQESMAGAQNQITEAIESRDQEQSEAIAKTQAEAEAMSAQAQVEQEQSIAQSRDAIQSEKKKGMEESKAVLENYQGEVGKAKDKQLKQIETRISSDEQKVQGRFDQADKKIKEEEKNAEKEKEEAKKKKKKKKKRRKWWQKIGDAIASVVDSIADAVSKIVDTLKKVVKGIIEAAQKFANSIIDAARNFVVNAIKSFANLAKGFLNVALAAFPGIRDRVNAFIDEAVNKTIEAVNMIADKLKEGVNYLAENLNKIVDFVANFYESIIQGGLALLKAVVTGNFDELPKIAFMTACNALGLPGEEFWGILMKAKDEALNIIKDPISFLKNLIGAGKKGFGQFMSNVGKHLEKGLFGWLFGQIAATGIQLPDKFDAAGIFDLVRQVLGFTWDYVRGRIVGIIGEENMERIETVAGYFQMLFTEGPMAVFNELKGKLTAIKPTIVKEIQSWVITKVIQKAVMKIMSMLIPGAGFVQAIWGMWQSLQFFIEKIHDIADLVNTILDSIGLIARGNIGPAANYVEKTMVKTLPIVFAFLAKLIGLGGIGAKIAKIIDKLRTPVNKAIDTVVGGMAKGGKSLLGKAKAGAKKGWNKVKSGAKKGWNKTKEGVKAGVGKVKAGVSTVKENVTEWWKKRTKFKTNSGEHTLYLKKGRGGYTLIMASRPEEINRKIRYWTDMIRTNPELSSQGDLRDALESASKHSQRIQELLEAQSSSDTEGTSTISALIEDKTFQENLGILYDKIGGPFSTDSQDQSSPDDNLQTFMTKIDAILTSRHNPIDQDYISSTLPDNSEDVSTVGMGPRYNTFRVNFYKSYEQAKNVLKGKITLSPAQQDDLLKSIKNYKEKLSILSKVREILEDLSDVDQGNKEKAQERKGTTVLKVGQTPDIRRDLGNRTIAYGKYSDITWQGNLITPGTHFVTISGQGIRPDKAVNYATGGTTDNPNISKHATGVLQQARNAAMKYKDIKFMVPVASEAEDPFSGKQSKTFDGGDISIGMSEDGKSKINTGFQDAERKLYSNLYNDIKLFFVDTYLAKNPVEDIENKAERLAQSEMEDFETFFANSDKKKAEEEDKKRIKTQNEKKRAKAKQDGNEAEFQEKEFDQESFDLSFEKRMQANYAKKFKAKVLEKKNELSVDQKLAAERFFEQERGNVVGNLEIYVEMNPCDQCQGVIRLVANWFPSIKGSIKFGVDYEGRKKEKE